MKVGWEVLHVCCAADSVDSRLEMLGAGSILSSKEFRWSSEWQSRGLVSRWQAEAKVKNRWNSPGET